MQIREQAITNYIDLERKIILADASRVEQEEKLKGNIKEIYYSLQPIAILKNAVNKLSEDSGIKDNIATLGVKAGADYLIGKLFGRSSSLKGYFSSIFFEKIMAI